MEGELELCAVILQPEEGNATREFSLAVVIASTGNFPQGNPLYTPTVVTLKVYLCEESMIKNNAVSYQFALPFLLILSQIMIFFQIFNSQFHLKTTL